MKARLARAYEAFDRLQQRHASIGLPLAVIQKYGEDQGGFLAATIAYYGFFAVFPLLLILTTVLGFVLRGDPHLSQRIVDSALAQFPVIGADIRVGALHGSGIALVIGSASAIWAGSGVFLAAENAMNQIWGVPFKGRLDFIRARIRAFPLLLLLGGGTLATTVLGGATSAGTGLGAAWKVASLALSVVLDFGLFWLGFRLLTAGDATWRQLRGGALAAAVLYALLQLAGGFYVGHVLRNAGNIYGTFALVIGLLSWIYLGATITLLAAEANVVATRRLWPRSFSVVSEQPATAADKRALRQRGKVEERRSDETVSVEFEDADGRDGG